MNQEVYFAVDSPGYEYPADGFGLRGVRLKTIPGKRAEVKIRRTQLAERIYRITGRGIYRDSVLLGEPTPPASTDIAGGVVGQDSVQVVRCGDKYLWIWGDTNLPHYPLGNFRVTAATTPLPGKNQFDPDVEIPFEYFLDDETHYVKQILPDDLPGAVWLWGLLSCRDDRGEESILAHYSRHLSLGDMVEQGIAEWNGQQQQFVKVRRLPMTYTWQVPRGHAVRYSDERGDYIYFAEPFATTRVAANRSAVLDPEQYEALAWDPELGRYRWQRAQGPITQSDESAFVAAGQIPADAAHFQVVDWDTKLPVEMHRGSVQWNAYRRRWILIGCQVDHGGKPSHLGEIWYAESESIIGPWTWAVKIATHPNYTFYNPRHHVELDGAGGRIIYFEGTYTQAFSANPVATPRYDYNQMMYRLDLARLPWQVTDKPSDGGEH